MSIKITRINMIKIARLFSNIFSPMLVPTYGTFLAMWFSMFVFLPEQTRWTAVIATFAITGILPMVAIAILLYMGKISDFGVNEKQDRLVPYIIATLCYIGCAIYFYRAHAPMWFVMFFIGASLTIIVSATINFWWKISGHSAAMGGLVAILFRIVAEGQNVVDILPVISVVTILAGIVGTSRIMLDRHSLLQVIAGFFNGLICVYACSALF